MTTDPRPTGRDYRGTFDVLLAHSNDGVALNAVQSQEFVKVSDSFCALTGYRQDELIGHTSIDLGLVDEDDVQIDIRDRARQGAEGTYTTRLRRKDGSLRVIEFSQTLLQDSDLVLTIVRDVTERFEADNTRARLAAIVGCSADAIVGITRQGTIESWNEGAERLYGYRPDEVLGKPAAMLMAPDGAQERERLLEQVLSGTLIEQIETEDVRKDGTRVAVAITVSPIRISGGVVIGAARFARDITERKRLEDQLRYYAEHDALTGLLNRRRFSEELAREAVMVSRYGEVASVLLADLDNLKQVNDTFGHDAGDDLIAEVASVFRHRLRRSDIPTRLGGDEFAALLPHTNLEEARMLGESVRSAVQAINVTKGSKKIGCTVSIGISVLTSDMAPEAALAAADQAMYTAKARGRNRLAVTDGGPAA